MITHLSALTRYRIDEIRAFHVPTRRRWWEWVFRSPVRCTMCGVPIGRCRQRRWADDVVAGRQAPAGWAP